MKAPIKLSISTWLILPITLGALLIVAVTYFVTMDSVQDHLLEGVKISLKEQTESVAWHIEAEQAQISNAMIQGANRLAQPDLNPTDLRSTLARIIEQSRGAIYGVTYAPIMEEGEAESHYLNLDQWHAGLPCTAKSLAEFDCREESWYKPALLTMDIAWSQAKANDNQGNHVFMYCSVPIYQGQKVIAILAAEVRLDWLKKALETVKVNYKGYVSLLSLHGRVISYVKEGNTGRFVESVVRQEEFPASYDILQRAEQGYKDVVDYVTIKNSEQSLLSFAPIGNTRWSVSILAKISAIEAESDMITHRFMLLVLLGVAVIVVIVVLIAKSFARSISHLDFATQVISSGAIRSPLPFAGESVIKEISHLESSFASMQSQLILHMDELEENAKSKERVEGELVAAHQIQMSLVPKVFPPFPDKPRLDLFALLEPARDIGGDLYDYFLMDDEDLCVIIGDVSGKGIPAALFMAVTRSYIRSFWHSGIKLEDVISEVNNQLSINNENMMFVTLFCAKINLWTGEMIYVNAGHTCPFLARKGEEVQSLATTGGFIVGFAKGTEFKSKTMQLRPGDSIVFFTDGANESMNVRDECLGEDALKAIFSMTRDLSAYEITQALRECIAVHAQGAVQNDDITLMVLKLLEKRVELPEWMPKITKQDAVHGHVFSQGVR